MTVKIYVYHIIDKQGNYIERNLPELHHAETVVKFLEETESRYDLAIVSEHKPQLDNHILGRDPDLH